MVAKARKLAGEFTAAFDQMAREAEMEELRKEIEDLKKNNPVADAKRAVTETLAPIDRELRKEAREINEAATAPVPDPAAPRPPQEAADEGAAVQSGQTLGEPAKS
jgi:sec-independent protein translocase protein TatB